MKLNTRREISHLKDGNDVFVDFPKFSDYFPKLSEAHTNISEHFLKITGFTTTSNEDVSIKHKKFKGNLKG